MAVRRLEHLRMGKSGRRSTGSDDAPPLDEKGKDNSIADLDTARHKVRSVAELLAARDIMGRVGQWDEGGERMFTRERQQQATMGFFQQLYQLLKYSPGRDYQQKQEEGVDAAAAKLMPTASEGTTGSAKKKKLGAASFDIRELSAGTVVEGAVYTRQQLQAMRKTHPLLRHSPVLGLVKALDLLDDSHSHQRFPPEPAKQQTSAPPPPSSRVPSHSFPKPPATGTSPATEASGVSIDDLPASTPVSHSTDGARDVVCKKEAASAALPKLELADPSYSSLMMQLKKTKRAVESHAQSVNTVQALLDLDSSPQLKKTITKIFANPKDAAAISQAECNRRQQLYNVERTRLQQQQQHELKNQRAELEREIGHLLTPGTL
ncbi:hypothetical protein DIPPA_14551 [Diplonema papillatum]|nr:hypothetical protein DIPPA_14551 [Diplonema papillatum]